MAKRLALSVGQVAKRCGVNVSTLHFYETKGLIESWRNSGNQRRFYQDVIRRVSIIKAAQQIGIDLASIKSALDTLPDHRTPTVKDWEKLAQQWNHVLSLRIKKLKNLQDSLSGCIGCGCLSLSHCPIYNQDDHLGEDSSGPVILQRKNKQ